MNAKTAAIFAAAIVDNHLAAVSAANWRSQQMLAAAAALRSAKR